MKYFHPETDAIRKLGAEPPVTETHGTEDDIRANMQTYKPYSWELRGNQLIGYTKLGKVVQTIPSDRILAGTDKDGYPILRKVVV